jgi:hypothetical protein
MRGCVRDRRWPYLVALALSQASQFWKTRSAEKGLRCRAPATVSTMKRTVSDAQHLDDEAIIVKDANTQLRGLRAKRLV